MIHSGVDYGVNASTPSIAALTPPIDARDFSDRVRLREVVALNRSLQKLITAANSNNPLLPVHSVSDRLSEETRTIFRFYHVPLLGIWSSRPRQGEKDLASTVHWLAQPQA
ncbi:hypothetical protein AcW1_005573 [Taiwanofungus camphoratus]|nr:hypothetical protein AcV5_005899 [Antrodia cinnamomea]KAI0957065.1 hypothetical protein AcW1_005573 [Antrodia cinnamomea]